MAPIKIVAFLNAYSQGLSGGDSLFLIYLKNHLKDRFTIITPRLGSQLIQKNNLKADFIITTTEQKFRHPLLTYLHRILLSVQKLPSIKNYQVIHSSSDFLPDTLPSFFLKLKQPSAVWEQKIYHLIPINRPISWLAQLLSFMLIKHRADRIFVDNRQLSDVLVSRHHFDPQKIVLIQPQVDLTLIAQSPKSKQKYSAVFVGQLRPSKGIFDLPLIWQQVVQKCPQATLAVIGQDIDGNSQKLKNLIIKNNLTNHIKLLGFVSSRQKFGLLKSSPLLVLPSYEEGYGLVVAEALKCGARPVAYDLPVFKEYFPQQVLTAPIGDTAAISRLIIQTLDVSKN